MAYHNGSIWPHDNAIIASGFARYGLMKEAESVFSALYDASLFFDLHRLPELFCGFKRRPGESPTQYPVSCSPQTWASASVFMLLQSMLGLTVRGAESELVFSHPALPAFLPEVRLRGLRVGEGRVDLQLERHERDVGVNVLERDGDIRVLVMK
jgi:glycogen debranching enzyme